MEAIMKAKTFGAEPFDPPGLIDDAALVRLTKEIERINAEARKRYTFLKHDAVRLRDVDTTVVGGCGVKIDIFFDLDNNVRQRLMAAINGPLSGTPDDQSLLV